MTSTDSFLVNVSVTGCVPNNSCEPALGETALNCVDCACNNNGICDGSETFANCPNDCHCGNGICDYDETQFTCSSDCHGNPPPPPPFEITDLTVSNITQNSVDITWNTSELAICVTNIGQTMDYASSSLVEIGYSLTHATAISGLSSGTVYHYIIKCYSATDFKNDTTGDRSFMTLLGPYQQQPPVENLYSAPDENFIILTWTNPTNVGFAGVVIRRQLGECPDLNTGEQVYNGLGNPIVTGEVNYQNVGLNPGTSYYYTVYAYDINNNYSTGVCRMDTTTGIPPLGNVISLRAEPGQTNIALFWQNPTVANFNGVTIRRSQNGFPGSPTAGTSVYDGIGDSAISPEVTFNDIGLTTSTLYYYSVFAHNTLNQFSSGAFVQAMTLPGDNVSTTVTSTTPLPTSTTPFPTSTPPVVDDLIFPDFDVNIAGTITSGRSDGAVLLLQDESVLITLRGERALPQTQRMTFVVTIEGNTQTYLFSYDAATNTYVVNIAGISNLGSYPFVINVYDSNNSIIKQIFGRLIIAEKDQILPYAPEIIQNIAKAAVETYNTISQIAQSDIGKTVAGAIIALSAINAALAFPWWLLQFLFSQPFILLFGRRRWGVVYNSITKKPVDLALVRLYDAMTDKLIASRVTDALGRYLFLVDPGEYKITVEKPGFAFPSLLLRHAKNDAEYADIYYGENITIGILGKSAIIANIAIDPNDIKITDKEALRNISRDHLKRIIGSLGPIFALLYFIFFPSLYSGILVLLHLFATLAFHRYSAKQIRNYWGHVYDKTDKKPISRAVTRIFSSEYGRMLEYYVTDSKGRYGFLVGANRYYVTGDKPGYETAKTNDINLLGKPGEQIIAENLSLKKISDKDVESVNLEPDEIPETITAENIQSSSTGSEAIKKDEEKKEADDLAAVMDSMGTEKKMSAEMGELQKGESPESPEKGYEQK